MSKSVGSRRIVALVAAYVIVLQALLLPLSVVAEASFSSSLCVASAEGAQPPSHHETCPWAASCGMQCCGQALIGPPQVAVAVALTQARALTPAPAIEPVVRPASKGPQVPRAPPAA